jgi:phosphatidylglycerol:prolipoprotein diacylglycerol transferase
MLFDRCYPKVSDWLFDITQQTVDLRFLPLYSYGFWVAMGFLSAAIVVRFEFKRREQLGLFNSSEKTIVTGEIDYFSFVISAIVGYFVGSRGLSYFGINFSPEIAGGVFAALFLALRVGYYFYTKPKEKTTGVVTIYPSDLVGDLVIVAMIFGVLGAILFNYLESPDGYEGFWDDPISYLFSGLSVFGGMICAGLAILFIAYKRRIHVPNLFDALGYCFILANGIGRIGCQVSGDGDWGIVNPHQKPSFIPEFLWSSTYKYNIIDAGVCMPGCTEEHCMQLAQAVYPTPIYEFLMCTTIFLILHALRKKLTPMPGMLFFVFSVFIGIQRFLIEQIRDLGERNLYHTFFGDFKQSELISIGMFTAGVLGIIWTYIYYTKIKKPTDLTLKSDS